MMKKTFAILTILSAILLPTPTQGAKAYHAFGLWGDGGYSQMLTDMPGTGVPMGWNAGAGALYELKYGRLMFQTGVGFRYQDIRCSAPDTAFTWEGVMDNDPINPKRVDVHYSFYDHRDRCRNWYIEVPMLFGTFFAARGYDGPGQGYFLAGPKLRLSIAGSSTASAIGTTTGTYAEYIGDWVEMDGHGFRKNVPISADGPKLDLGVDLGIHAEIGYEYGKENQRGQSRRMRQMQRKDEVRPIVRIAGFVDCGLLSIMPDNRVSGNGVPLDLVAVPRSTMYDFPSYQVNHVFRTEGASAYWLRNLFVGIKLTVLFRLPNHEGCVICNEATYTTYKRRMKQSGPKRR